MALTITLLVVSVLLIASILLQSRGSSLGLAFGGDGNVYRTRRGVEKNLHYATILLSVAFLVLALLDTIR